MSNDSTADRGDRLQKLLARVGLGSRRAIEEWIRAGRVTVNGTVATLGDKADPSQDAVKLDGKRVLFDRLEPLYLLLHKPPNVVSTASDPEGRRTVMDLVPKSLKKGLVPVGRLDFQTTGLILLTNDGDFAQRIAHPRFGCTKTYEVKVVGQPSEASLDKLRRGLKLDGKRTAPAEIDSRPLPRGQGSDGTNWFTVELIEGRTRQIREMFLRIGHPVRKLRRVAIGGLSDPGLPPGHWRELSPEEVRRLLTPRPIKAPRRRAPKPAPAGDIRGKDAADKGSGRGAAKGPRGKGPGGKGPGSGGGAKRGTRGTGRGASGPGGKSGDSRRGGRSGPSGGPKKGGRPGSRRPSGGPRGPKKGR